MILPSEYYEKNLYPLQDGVMNTIKKCGSWFFLTGGTALSRAYYNHRYSDDLEFFVNDDEYAEQLKMIFSKLKEDGFFWDTTKDFVTAKAFTSLIVGWNKSDTLLKLDFVNDTAVRFGDYVKTDLFYRTDSIRNILSNKLTCLFRFAAKDIADIREIALQTKVDWKLAFRDAQHKDAGIDAVVACDILRGFPQSEFETIAWVKKPEWEVFRHDIEKIIYQMISGETGD